MNTADSSAPHSYTLGGYEISSAAGAGGMGVVYKGVDPALGRPVAIKVLKDELQSHPAVVARFRREAEAIATLNHPNIVRIYAVGDRDSLPYIVMEFVEGVPLSDVLIESGSLPWEEALDIGVQVADALICAHACQVIHRDIKPANILIREDGVVKVTDFGIAKVLNASTQLTVDGARIGTPQYMCPERCKSLPITPGSDIYSLGVMLFQCITGRLPFEAKSSAELINKISHEVPRRVRALKPDVPESVDRLIAYMLEKDASNRPPDSAALRDLIERVRRGDRGAEDILPMDRALEAVRAETPLPPPVVEATTVETSGWWTRLRETWFAVPSGLRIVLALGVLAGLAGGVGHVVWSVSEEREALARRFAPHADSSRWTTRNSLAYFESETGSVLRGTLPFPDRGLVQLAWIGGADGVVALLRGHSEGPRAGESTLLTINPYLRQANVSMAPFGTADWPSDVRLLDGGSSSQENAGMVLTHDGTTWLLSAVPGATPSVLAPWPATAAVQLAGPARDVLLFQQEERGGRLVRVNTLRPGVGAEAVPVDGIVQEMALDPQHDSMALWIHGQGLDRVEWRTTRRLEEAGTVLAEGSLHLSHRPFQGDGGGVALVQEVEDGVGQAIIQSQFNPADRRVLGEACAVAWRPGVAELILMAPDHAGRRQLWRVSAIQPDERSQITYLDSGLGDSLCLADDGTYAVANLPDSTAFVIVTL